MSVKGLARGVSRVLLRVRQACVPWRDSEFLVRQNLSFPLQDLEIEDRVIGWMVDASAISWFGVETGQYGLIREHACNHSTMILFKK